MGDPGEDTKSSLEDSCFGWIALALLQTLLVYILSLFWGGIEVLVAGYALLLLVSAATLLIPSLVKARKRRGSFAVLRYTRNTIRRR